MASATCHLAGADSFKGLIYGAQTHERASERKGELFQDRRLEPARPRHSEDMNCDIISERLYYRVPSCRKPKHDWRQFTTDESRKNTNLRSTRLAAARRNQSTTLSLIHLFLPSSHHACMRLEIDSSTCSRRSFVRSFVPSQWNALLCRLGFVSFDSSEISAPLVFDFHSSSASRDPLTRQ